ncbi:MAG: dienelactone hydrolase family protein [Pseudoclavibacter sp.]|jgi:phospholipase/carboxylesterase
MLAARTSWGAGAAPDADAPLVVLLHGYGTDQHDLVPLIEGMVPPSAAWASLRGPRELTFGGAEWFPIETLVAPAASDLAAAAAAIWDWLDAHGSGRRIVPIGFSQGGVMALELLRERPGRVAAAAVLSGFAAAPVRPGDAVLADHPAPVFWGRGDQDDVIPAVLVAWTAQWLPAHARLDAHRYPGLPHGISPAEVADLAAFLRPVLRAAGSAGQRS